MEEDLPIDIHYNKLLDWLISRRHCDSKWHVECKAIRSEVAAALKDLPQDNQELQHITQDESRLNYFDCKSILEVLKELDGDGKSLFGQYTAPRVKVWAELVKRYERGDVYLAECGQQLARLVNYEIPNITHHISRSQQISRDSLRQEEELRVNADTLKDKYELSCQEMGIQGANVKLELTQLLHELPQVYGRVLELLPNMLPSITFYERFLRTIGSTVNEDQYLPMLSYILKYGNVTVYQWRHGEPPALDQNQIPAENGNVTEEPSIDWGLDTGMVSRQDDGIDFGDIDFGDLAIEGEGEGGVSIITLEGSGTGEGVALQEGMSSQEGVALQEGVASQEGVKEYTACELQSLLEWPSTRNLFLNDLLELKEFLSRRNHELNSNATSTVQTMCIEEFGMESSNEEVGRMLGHVMSVLDHMSSKRVQHLFHMKGSQRYLQRLSEELLHNLRLSNKAGSQALEAGVRRELANTNITQLQPQHAELVRRTRELQAQMSAEISRRYKNRTVNIMGEINQI